MHFFLFSLSCKKITCTYSSIESGISLGVGGGGMGMGGGIGGWGGKKGIENRTLDWVRTNEEPGAGRETIPLALCYVITLVSEESREFLLLVHGEGPDVFLVVILRDGGGGWRLLVVREIGRRRQRGRIAGGGVAGHGRRHNGYGREGVVRRLWQASSRRRLRVRWVRWVRERSVRLSTIVQPLDGRQRRGAVRGRRAGGDSSSGGDGGGGGGAV